MTREELEKNHPEVTLLDGENFHALASYLVRQQLMADGEVLERVEKPGEGNMNYTLRIVTNRQNFILKQSRPWVEKYPHIEAPWDRVLEEARFYAYAREIAGVADQIPEIIHLDPVSRVLVCSDLGEARDFTDCYAGAKLRPDEIEELGKWLSALHNHGFNKKMREDLSNTPMRILNHEHIFHFPLCKENGLDLDGITPGLGDLAEGLKSLSSFAEKVDALGKIYLSEGASLLHGDFFPGSWLRSRTGVKLIDAEFSFFGEAEFDVGVYFAHLCLSLQEEAAFSLFQKFYKPGPYFQFSRAKQFAGVEIMRRLLGVAQLPLPYGLEKKKPLLDLARRLVLEPENVPLGSRD